MTVRALDQTPVSAVIDCFIAAFQGYYVPMPSDPKYYKKRWIEQAIRFDLSFGLFDEEDTLIAFILHTLDWRGEACYAYNAGTGVLPLYRGKGLVKKLYEAALPKLKESEAVGIYLEVITKNEKAIGLYQSIGFEKTRQLDCMEGPINDPNPLPIMLRRIDWTRIPWEQVDQSTAAWSHHEKALNGEIAQFYQVLIKKSIPKKVGYFIITPNHKYLYQIGTKNDTDEQWQAVISGLAYQSDHLKAINVDHSTKGTAFLKAAGLKHYISQYEMRWMF
jgi:GNAT superfamily N-acetyltransferase